MSASMAMGGSGSAGLDSFEARHPILTEEPADDGQRQRLTDELKARGNGAFKAKSMREALVLYTRAIELTPDAAALRGNSSMVQLQLGDFKAALGDAEEAIRLDASWAKGYYRKAQALEKLEQYSDASFAMEEAIRRTDNEKAKKPMEKAVLEYQKKAAEKPKPNPLDVVAPDRFKKAGEGGDFGGGADGSATTYLNNAPPPAKAAAKPSAASTAARSERAAKLAKPDAAATAATAAPAPAAASGAEMKGYKTLADGTKTSFFHMEVSDEAKKLQEAQGLMKAGGNKIDAAEVAKHEASVVDGASAWNSSGTFEEKDMLKWSKERLTELLVTEEPPAGGGGSGRISKVFDVEGDALWTFRKGKKGCIFDLNFVASWSDGPAGGCEAGKCTVTNFTNDGGGSDGDEYEVIYSPSPPAELKESLRSKLETGLAAWVVDFTKK
jgi:tetratricopeptide (TPR) repeat protein